MLFAPKYRVWFSPFHLCLILWILKLSLCLHDLIAGLGQGQLQKDRMGGTRNRSPGSLFSGRGGESVQFERWIRVSRRPSDCGKQTDQSCWDKQWAETADREYSVGPGQRPEQETETRDVLSGNKVLLIRLGFITRTPLPWSQGDGDNWENKKPGTPS